MKVGDRVRFKDDRGGRFRVCGTVTAIIPGRWSNGGVPMVRVSWESKTGTATYSARHTQSLLEAAPRQGHLAPKPYEPETPMYRYVTREEVPYDDGTPTGNVFVYQQRYAGADPLTGEEEWEDTEFVPQGPMSHEEARRLLGKWRQS